MGMRVPRDDGQSIHGMIGTDSTRRWAAILRDRGQVGTAEGLKVFLDAGADVNARVETGWTALMWPVGSGTAENVKLLLDVGADASLKSNVGSTAWDHAQGNEKLKDTDAYWMLNDARFK